MGWLLFQRLCSGWLERAAGVEPDRWVGSADHHCYVGELPRELARYEDWLLLVEVMLELAPDELAALGFPRTSGQKRRARLPMPKPVTARIEDQLLVDRVLQDP